MDPLRSFSDYDLLAHVPQGFLAFAATDYVFGTDIIIGRTDWTAGYVILILILSYAAGHLIAGPSHFVLEKGLARNILGGSSANLLSHSKNASFWAHIFPEYFQQAGYPTRTAVLAKTGIAEPTPDRTEDAFWTAYRASRADQYTLGRLRTFLNLYGFCRNLAFLAGSTALILMVRLAATTTPAEFWTLPGVGVVVFLLISSFLMIQRYLKFYRLYTLEVFMFYSGTKD